MLGERAGDAPTVPLRFSAADRLRKRPEFQEVYARGRRGHAIPFVVFVARGATGRHRLGLTVSKRCGKAVIRNRIKRRLREAFRLHRHQLPGCYDIVVNARAEVARWPLDDLARTLVKTVREATGPRRQHRRRRGKRTC
ncbi:MAG: ribonuclease P protein component [Acidobacteriota bacterium]